MNIVQVTITAERTDGKHVTHVPCTKCLQFQILETFFFYQEHILFTIFLSQHPLSATTK